MSEPESAMKPGWRTFMNLDTKPAGGASPDAGGHIALSPTDPDNPQNWPLRRKLFASCAAAAFTFALYVTSGTSAGES